MSLPTQSFEALLWNDELEERVEFGWSVSGGGSCDSDGNCSVQVEGTYTF